MTTFFDAKSKSFFGHETIDRSDVHRSKCTYKNTTLNGIGCFFYSLRLQTYFMQSTNRHDLRMRA